MLQLRDKSKADNRHEEAFLARFEQVRKWARHFTAGQPGHADDLVQDAFIQFMAIRPDLDQLRSLDAFLYTVVRNLHRSMLHRHLRLRQVPLSILDFDCVEEGLKSIERRHLERVFDDLIAICDFACRRKEVAKSGSLLILRFFHGHTIRETVALMAISRGAVDERLRHARKEAREHLLERQAKLAGKVVELSASASEQPPSAFRLDFHDDVLEILRTRIFSSKQSECPPRSQMRAAYKESSNTGIDQPLLAHIVSCRTCLSAAARHLKLESTDGPAGGDPPVSSEKVSKARRIHQLRRQFERTMDHRPQELRVTVNGLPLASQAVVAGRGDLSVSVPLTERIEFVEVLSEQEVRLLMLPVEAAPPEGECEQTGRLDFGDGRTLTIALTFDDPWPTVHVHYAAPETIEEPAVFRSVEPPPPDGLVRRLLGWIHPPRRWAPIVATLMIAVFLFVQERETTASAAEVLNGMNIWQRTIAKPSMVLHRTFDFVETPKHAGQGKHRRVEVWRRPDDGVKVSRLLDPSGALLESVRLNVLPAKLTASNAWQFDPAADSFRALAPDLTSAHVKQSGNTIHLDSDAIQLRVDRSSYKPTYEAIETPGAKFEFKETGTEPVPETASPLAEAPPRAAVASLRAPELPKAPVVLPRVSEADLDTAELAVRQVLHRLSADLGESIQVHRRDQEIEVAGVLDSATRKQEIQSALGGLAHVRTSLLTQEDLDAVPLVAAGTLAALQTQPETATSRPALLADWLKSQYPNENERRAFTARVIELSRRCLGRAYALKDLSGRPSFDSIFQDHLAALEKNWTQLNELAAPAVGSPPATGLPSADARPSAKLFDDINALNRSILRLFAAGSEAATLDTELSNYWRLRQDTAAQLASLSRH